MRYYSINAQFNAPFPSAFRARLTNRQHDVVWLSPSAVCIVAACCAYRRSLLLTSTLKAAETEPLTPSQSLRFAPDFMFRNNLHPESPPFFLSLSGARAPTTPSTCVLLLFDRRDDPITPLLNQWTFQAMVHELIGINRNRVCLESGGQAEEVVLSVSTDEFFASHWDANFGDLGVAVQNYLKKYQDQTHLTNKPETVEDMRNLVDKYPEFRKFSTSVTKHVSIVHSLSRLVEANSLLDVSVLEQQLACSDNKTEHLKSLLDRLRLPNLPKYEKLRLVLLYALRYENDSYIPKLKDELRNCGIDGNQIEIVDALIAHAGAERRQSELFQKLDFLQLARNVVQRGLKGGASNVYTQHVPYLLSVVEALIKGKLHESQYTTIPYNRSSPPTDYHQQQQQQQQQSALAIIVVFIVGGATYEEALALSQLAQQHKDVVIVLGGTTIHNSKTFLADVAQLHQAHNQAHHHQHHHAWELLDPITGVWSDNSSAAQQPQSSTLLFPPSSRRASTTTSTRVVSTTATPSSQEMIDANHFTSRPSASSSSSSLMVNVPSSRQADLASKQEFLRQKW